MERKRELLIVDGNPVILRLLNNVLSKDYRVVAKRDCIDAFQWMENGHHPALIILDMDLCANDGFHIIRNLKISGLYRDIPLVLLTSSNRPPAQVPAEVRKADACFNKPFDPLRLQEAIVSLINARYNNVAA